MVSIRLNKGFIYTLMGILICEAGNGGNSRAVGSGAGADVVFLALLQAIKKDNTLIIKIPRNNVMVAIVRFET